MSEYVSEYENELEFVKDSEDNLYPDFLFNPLYNDFDDNYYQKSFANDELSSMVKKLRRRYSNFFDWVDAMEIYNEYMDKLVDKYGSMRVINNALKADMMEDDVPAKPRLKNTKRNRQFSKTGIIPARKMDFGELTSDEMLVIARQTFPGATGEGITEEALHEKLPKELRKKVKHMQEQLAGQERKRNLYRSVGNNSGTDFIVEYLNQAKRGVYDSSGNKGNGYDNRALIEMVEEDERNALIPEEIRELDELDPTEIVGGRLVRRSENMRMEIYKELYSEGIDVIGSLGKRMDKKAVKLIRSHIGANEPMTKKEMKKMKKRAKKDREQMERRRDSNELLEKTLLGNKFSFKEDGNTLSFRLKDIYRD